MHWGSIFLGNSSHARALHQLDPCNPAGQAAPSSGSRTSGDIPDSGEHGAHGATVQVLLAFNPRSTRETAVKTLLTLFQR